MFSQRRWIIHMPKDRLFIILRKWDKEEVEKKNWKGNEKNIIYIDLW